MTEFLRRIEAFFDILFTRNVATEIAALAACLWAGWWIGTLLRMRLEREAREPTALTWRYFATQGMVTVTPVLLALALVAAARGVLAAMQFDVSLLDSAIWLIGAFAVVRAGVLLFAASLGNNAINRG